MKDWIITDWAGNHLFINEAFESFEDGWEFIYENIKQENEDGWSSYFVIKKTDLKGQ